MFDRPGFLGQVPIKRMGDSQAPLPIPPEVIYRHPNPDGSRKKCGNCIAEDELVLIDGAPEKIGDVTSGKALSISGWNDIQGKQIRANQEVVEVRSLSGLRIRTTPDHKFHTDHGWVSASDLKSGINGHILSTLLEAPMSQRDLIDRRDALILGAITGDGWGSEKYGIGFGFRSEMAEAWKPMVEYARERFGSIERPRRFQKTKTAFVTPADSPFFIVDWRTKAAKEFCGKVDKSHIHKTIWNSTPECAGSYLRGLFSTDGSVCYCPGNVDQFKVLTVTLYNTDKALIDEVGLLLRIIGIRSTVTTEIRAPKYKDLYHLKIARLSSLKRFVEIIGFMDTRRQKILEEGIKVRKERSFVDYVRSVEGAGVANVVDIGVPRSQSFYASGFLVHNCNFWMAKENLCTLHGPSVVVAENMYCNYHIYGAPADKMETDLKYIEPELSGLRRAGGGLSCDVCIYYRETKPNEGGNCNGVANPDTGKPPAQVEAKGICSRQKAI